MSAKNKAMNDGELQDDRAQANMDENEVAALLNTTSDTDCVMQNGREDIPLMTQTPYEIQPKAQSDDTVSIHIDRRALNQEEFDKTFGYRPAYGSTIRGHLKRKIQKCGPGFVCRSLLNFVPIAKWLGSYERSWLLQDIIAGLTIGIMVVPQGMAYADLAGVDPIYGLYTSFFAPICYMIFGTSRHVSLGVFAVISLMVGAVRMRVLPDNGENGWEDQNLGANYTPIAVVSTVALSIGLVQFQLLMAVLQLSFLTAYLSDQVIGGFTTGAACHVLTSQLNKIIQVPVGRHNGLFKIFYMAQTQSKGRVNL